MRWRQRSTLKFGSLAPLKAEELFADFTRGRRDFTNLDLNEIDLRPSPATAEPRVMLDGIDLSGSRLQFAKLASCSLVGANLSGADLSGCDMFDVDLSLSIMVRVIVSSLEMPSLLMDTTFKAADLSGAKLQYGRFLGCCFDEALLQHADMNNFYSMWSTFVSARLTNASMKTAHLDQARFDGADLSGASLKRANLKRTVLRNSSLADTDLTGANLYSATIAGANFSRAYFQRTVVSNLDLVSASFVDTIHGGPSAVSTDTLERTAAALSVGDKKQGEVTAFLRRCGVAEHIVGYFHTMIGKPVSFYAAFISYSHSDNAFASLLHDSLQARGIRCWLDAYDLKPGDRILDVVNTAIRVSDKVLLCCSTSSLQSWWVKDEIRKAIERERQEKRAMIIPLMLDRYFLDDWNDGLAAELRSRLAADFSGWSADVSVFQRELERVVAALRC